MEFKKISQLEASSNGLKRFFTGVPCLNNHVAERYVNSGKCKACTDANTKKFRAENPDRVREARRKSDSNNREKINSKTREWYHRNPERAIKSVRDWQVKNKVKIDSYRLRVREKVNSAQKLRRPQRAASEPLFALQQLIRNRIGSAIRRSGYKKTSKTAELLGCSWPELKRHIELQFLKGMTWSGRGADWHIDHILPLAGADSRDELIALFHFTNLRPIWAIDNRVKYSKRLYLI